MHRAITGSLTLSVLAVLSFATLATAADLLPKPMEGWTASGPVYGESVIENGASETGKRIEVSRDYARDDGGLRISLNTHDQRGVQLIAHVNAVQKADPDAAARLAASGIVPFSFHSRPGVMMKASEKGQVTGAAIELDSVGTLTVEGVSDGRPDTVALEDVKAYLARIDLDRVTDFVRESNAAKGAE